MEKTSFEGDREKASYPVIVFAGVLVKLMERHLCVQFVCVRLEDINHNLKVKDTLNKALNSKKKS